VVSRKHGIRPRWPIDLPTVLLAGGWLAMWLLWPSQEAPRVLRRPHGARVSLAGVGGGADGLHVTPDLFGRPSAVGFRAPDSEGGVPDSLALRARHSSHALARTTDAAADRRDVHDLAESARGGLTRYTPVVAETPAFTRGTSEDLLMSVTMAPALAAAGFEFPRLAADEARVTGRAWIATICVELGADGRAEHVYLESGSGNAKIDGALVRAVAGGRAPGPCEGCRGLVTVSFGRR